jgi:hypothetical protein
MRRVPRSLKSVRKELPKPTRVYKRKNRESRQRVKAELRDYRADNLR